MADAMTRNQLVALARLGAEARIAELQAEIDAIRGMFGAPSAARRGRRPGAGLSAPATPRKRRRRKMSAQARKKISDAAKKRWAAYRATKRGKQ